MNNFDTTNNIYSSCTLCPRQCRTDRSVRPGRCGANNKIKLARAALHFWEEPCISGERGSGTVFFSGCPLGCVYCQNRNIASCRDGVEISRDRLVEIFFELDKKGAHNINLVTPDCYIPDVADAIRDAKAAGFTLPFICNCSGYHTLEAIDMLGELIDVWLPDFKYVSREYGAKYSNAPDYVDMAKSAIDRMFKLRPECIFDGNGMIRKGVIIRHMMLPEGLSESKSAVKYLYNRYGDAVWLSIMSQYTPFGTLPYPELYKKVTEKEYDALIDFAIDLGIENAFTQEGEAAEESFIPEFNCEGVLPENNN